MVRAKGRPDGITAPTCSGFSIHERRNRTSSSSRGFFSVRTDDCEGMRLEPDGDRANGGCQKTVTKTYRSPAGRSSRSTAGAVRHGSRELAITYCFVLGFSQGHSAAQNDMARMMARLLAEAS